MADLELTLIPIPSEWVARASAGILKQHPILLIDDPASTEENPLPAIPKYTVKRWAEILASRYIFREAFAGDQKIRNEIGKLEDWNS